MKTLSLKTALVYFIGILLLAGGKTALAGKPSTEWVAETVERQYRLQKFQPLKKTKLFGTHNSYSSKSAIGKLTYWENQQISITKQLEGGARVLEIDLNYDGSHREGDVIIVCHYGGGSHCGIDKAFCQGSLL